MRVIVERQTGQGDEEELRPHKIREGATTTNKVQDRGKERSKTVHTRRSVNGQRKK